MRPRAQWRSSVIPSRSPWMRPILPATRFPFPGYRRRCGRQRRAGRGVCAARYRAVAAGFQADTDGNLIQIAPDPVDPWCTDPFGRYSYRGSGSPPGPVGAASRFRRPHGHSNLRLRLRTPVHPEEGKNSLATWQPTWHHGQRSQAHGHAATPAGISRRVSAAATGWACALVLRRCRCVRGGSATLPACAGGTPVSRDMACCTTRPSDEFQLLVGIDYLDRDDIALLPVVGAVFKPHPDFRRGRGVSAAASRSAVCGGETLDVLWPPKWAEGPGPSNGRRLDERRGHLSRLPPVPGTAERRRGDARVTWKSATSSPGTSNTVREHLPMIR